jgi:Ca2+-binding RTX toxin-like protein
MPFSGQLWYITEGGDAETRLVRINDDGTTSTIINDNGGAGTGDNDFISSFTNDIGVDTAAGFYFAITNAPSPQDNVAYLVRGSIAGGAAPVTVVDFSDEIIVNGIEVDPLNHKIYVGCQDGTGADAGVNTGIRVYTYDPSTGAVSGGAFLTTAITDDRADIGGFKILDPHDFAIDYSIGRLFYSEDLNGGVNSVGLFRLDLASPNTVTRLVSALQFPDDASNGQIVDVEVDETTDLVYFTSRSLHPFGAAGTPAYDANLNAIWYISENASGGNATKVTLTGMPGSHFYGGDMTFDQGTRQIYVENSENSPSSTDDAIYVFQLNGAGTSAAWVRTISPGLLVNNAQVEGMTFVDVAALSVNGTATATTEQGSTTTLLTGAPTITDTDGGGYLTSATVQITGGTFSSNENSTADDHLGYSSSKQISGTIAGTSIMLSWNSVTETLTLTGYDTFAHYQTALAGITYWTTGDNPTNYGANTSRTATWTINDGTPGVLAGSVNSGTTTINLAAVNDAPVNGTVSSATGNENTDIAVTGLQISDVDANPAAATMTVVLSVTKGILTLRTNVASGLTAGNITSNGTGSVTVTGTQNAINLTLAASNGLVFHGNTNVSGTDTLTVVTSDGGATGSGGTQSDTDGYTITIIGVNDAPVVGGDGTEALAATNEDVGNTALTNTVSSLFSGQYSDPDTDTFAGVAVTVNGSTGGTGQWQYYNGSSWVNIGAASTAAAVTIAASAPIRFLPAADFNGSAPTLTVKLVDASGGALTNGAVVNTTTSGGTTPYSTGTVVLSHTVTAVNDAPTITGGSSVSLTSIGEDSAPGAGQTVSSLFTSHFSDAKDTVSGGSSANALAGVAVTANAATAAEGVYQYFAASAWHDLPAVSTASAFVLDASTLVRFVPAADYSGTAPALTVSLIDDSSGAVTTGATPDLTTTGGSTQYSAALTLNIVVTPTNDAPVASGSATLTAVNEDTANPAGQSVSTLFTSHFTDPDGDTLAGVAITGNAASSQGVWQYFSGSWTTIGSASESSALILAAGTLIRFLPAANFNGAVPALTAYLIDNSGGAVTTGTTLDVSVNGGQTRFSDASLDLTTSITAVNDTPVVPASATTVGATEQTAATLLGSLTVSDVDLDARNGGSGDYGGASFSVQRASANAADTFDFASGGLFTVSGANLQVGGLTFATFTSSGGVLTISFSSSAATATTALVNDVIEHIAYTNASNAPPASVTLTYALADGSPGGGQGAGATGTAGGSVVVNITGVNDAHTGGASITGTATEDQVLTAVSTLADVDGIGTLHYQWQRDDGVSFGNVGADQATYTLGDDDVGHPVRVVIYYTDAGGTVESATSTATASIAAVDDAPTGAVTITGTTTEDQVLTADPSAVADADVLGTFHYQWQHNVGSGYVDVGADQATYTLGDADVGGTVRVKVSYTDGQGFTDTVTSAGTASIAGVNDAHTGGASITGTAAEDQVLTAVSTLADVDNLGTLHYDWQRKVGAGSFVSIGATDQATYTLGDADVAATIRVVISYTDGQGFAEQATSTATASITAVDDAPTGAVTISGTTTEDQVLTADPSAVADADGLGTFHYQWQHNVGSGYVDVGADQATLTLGDADVGGTVRVKVSYTDGQGFTDTVTSAGTASIAAVDDAPTGAVTITGTTTEDQVLTADPSAVADADVLGTFHYQWQHNVGSGYVDVGADQATYTLSDADVGGTVRVKVSYTDGQGFTDTVTSAGTASIAGVNDAHTGGASITGTAAEDQVLTAVSTLADVDNLGTLHYDWQRKVGAGSFVSIGATDQATYTLGDADVAATIRVVISYTDGQGFAEQATSTATASITAVDDAPTGAVTISGTTTEDQVLTADPSAVADADGLGTFHYQWQHNVGSGYVDVGADQATYTLGDADVGGTVRVKVSYTDGQGFTDTVTSAGTASIANVNDAPTGAVSVTGTTTEDQVLTADTSTLADADALGTLSYDWQRKVGVGSFVSIGAADQATYTLGDADVGATIRVVVSYTDQQLTAETVTSTATASIAAVDDAPTGAVTISGTTTEDQVLTADPSAVADADGLGTFHYQWQHNVGSGYVDVGADQATYTLGDGDVGGTVRVKVSYTDGQGFTDTVTSAGTASIANVNDAPTGAVTVTGTTTEDQVLTADTSTLADADVLGTLHYQWQHNVGSGYVDVGADQATYTLGDGDVGGTVRVKVSYTDQQLTAETVTSAGTPSIAGVNDAPTGAVTVTGTTTEDQVLTADTSTLADADVLGTLSYDWQRKVGVGSFVSIGAADQATYTLGDADVGATIRVVVSYTDQQLTAETVTSTATASIAAVDDAPTGAVTISGTTTEDQVLTADPSAVADADGLGTFHYQWQHNVGSGYVDVGADQATYTLGDADVGGTVRVKVSYTDGQGFTDTVTSAGTASIANVNDAPTGAVTIDGTANTGQVLTANTLTLADADGLGAFHYQWQRDSGSGFVAVGADQATYALTAADLGAVLRVVTSYTDGNGTGEAKTSAATSTVLPPNGPHTGTVTITGTATEDLVLTANTSTLADPAGLGAFHYQWQRSLIGGGFANVGTDQATYTLGDADVGAQIRVKVTFTDGQGVLESETSGSTAAVVNVNDAPTGTVTITGTVAEDQVLTAVSTLADADGLGPLHYQWQRNAGSGFVNVGTDQATYTLGDSDVSATIRVVTTYTDLHGTPESKTSTATAAVANVNDTPTAANDANAVTQRLTVTGTVRTNDGDIDTGAASLTVTNVAYNATHVDQAVVAGGTVVNGANGKLTIKPDGSYSYVADHEGLVVGQVVTDKFDYTIKDPSGASATAQLTVTVTGSATGDANANILISDGSAHTLTGKGGADTLTGAGGADVFAYEAVSDSTIAAFDTITDFATGVDTLRLTPLMTGTTKLTLSTTGASKTLFIDQNGDGVAEGKIYFQTSTAPEVADIVTGVANFGFILNGSIGADILKGGSGADAINGSAGADIIRGGGGGDVLNGGMGSDTFVYGDGDSTILHWDVITDFQTGQDRLDISAADDGIVILARFGASTFIYFGALGNSSVVQVFGDIRTSDLVVSNHVTFSMYGDDGHGGGSGSDSLSGGDQDDVLVGGTTDSTLFGGNGADLMYGGVAHDTFVYTSISNSNFSAYDSIIDFTSGQDKIDISAIDGGKITIGRYDGTTFIYSAPDSGGNFQSVITVAGTSLKATDVIGSGGATQPFVMTGDGAGHNVADGLVGGAGNDILYGLDGNDVLIGAGGADFMLGGAGADTFVYTAPADSSTIASDLIFDFSHAEADKLDLTSIDANSGTGANDAFSVVTSFSNAAGQLIIAAPDASGYYHVSGDVNGDGVADFMIALKVTGTLTSADILL